MKNDQNLELEIEAARIEFEEARKEYDKLLPLAPLDPSIDFGGSFEDEKVLHDKFVKSRERYMSLIKKADSK